MYVTVSVNDGMSLAATERWANDGYHAQAPNSLFDSTAPTGAMGRFGNCPMPISINSVALRPLEQGIREPGSAMEWPARTQTK